MRRYDIRIPVLILSLGVFEGCLSLDSNPSRLQGGLAQLSEGRPELAALAFKGILQDFPGHPEAIFNLAVAHALSGNNETSLALLDRSHREGVDDEATTWTLRGYDYLRDGKVTMAIRNFKQALVTAPGYETASIFLALAYTLELDLGAADRVLTGVCGPAADRALPSILRGYIAYRRGQFEQALRQLDRARGSDTPPVVHYYEALSLYCLGRPAQARDALDLYLQAMPASPMGLYHRALAHFSAGSMEGARRDLETLFQTTEDLKQLPMESLRTRGAALWARL